MDKIMPKRINNIYYDAIKFKKFKSAYERTTVRKKTSYDRIKFGMYLEDNIYSIGTKLKDGTYEVAKYKSFKIYEPKEREIFCLNFGDRVVHQWYVYEYIIPYMIPKFIKDSYACIKGRGVHMAVDNLQKYMRMAKREWKSPYILKFDISKFFYSIDQEILYNIIKKYYKDKEFLKLTKNFILFDKCKQKAKEFGKGIPIGNYTSQFFANIYMNELDQYIKRELKIKYYVRYMDDGVMILENKKKTKEIFNLIEKFINEKLELKLNKKSSYVPIKAGVVFCGYKIYTTHKLLKRNNIIRMKKRIRTWNKSWSVKKYDFPKWKNSFCAWKGYANHASTYNLCKSLEKKCEWITEEKYF